MRHAALPHLIASGSGAIVNIGGLSAHTGAADRAHVITAKAGLAGLTRALAHDLAPHGITVNCVAPGLIDTARAGAEPAHHAVHGAARPGARKARGDRGARAGFCAGRKRATSPGRAFTPTAGCSQGKSAHRASLINVRERALGSLR